jgi:hypothetical protein
MSEQDWTDRQDAFNLLFSPQATTFNGVAYYFPDQAATAVSRVDFSADGKLLASCSGDKTTRSWMGAATVCRWRGRSTESSIRFASTARGLRACSRALSAGPTRQPLTAFPREKLPDLGVRLRELLEARRFRRPDVALQLQHPRLLSSD